MENIVDAAAEAEAPASPTKVSKEKAAQAAAVAAKAAHHAAALHKTTKTLIEADTLLDPKVPCVPVSPSTYTAEAVRSLPANVIARSPHCIYRDVDGVDVDDCSVTATMIDLPMSLDHEQYQSAKRQNLQAISFHNVPLSYHKATLLASILTDPDCKITRLDLTKAFEAHAEPAVEDTYIQSAIQAVRVEMTAPKEENEDGENDEEGDQQAPVAVEDDDDDEEGGEKVDEATAANVQAAVERLKGEYTTFQEGLHFLALKRLDRMKIVFDALSVNKTVKELRLGSNGFGAPDAEGRSSIAPLRKVAALIDANSSINVMDLSGNNMGPQGVGIIAKAMSKNISIHTLDLSGNDIVQDAAEDADDDPEAEEEDAVFGEVLQGLEALAEVLKKNKFLRVLSLRSNRIRSEIEDPIGNPDDDGAESSFGKFLEPLKKYHRLHVLDLADNELGAGGMKMVQAALNGNRSLQLLDVSGNELGPTGLIFVSRLLKETTTLESLYLMYNSLGGTTKKQRSSKRAVKETLKYMHQASQAIAGCKTLKNLHMGQNLLGVDFCDALLATLSSEEGQFEHHLEGLYMEGNAMCGEHAGSFDGRALAHIVFALTQKGSTLKKLSLPGNFLQFEGVRMLVEDTTTLRSLTYLSLARNSLGNEGCEVIANHLRDTSLSSNSEDHLLLTELDLSHNAITSLAQCGLIPALRVTSSLKRLNLSDNRLGSATAANFELFLDSVSARPLMESLNLDDNRLQPAHAKSLASMLRSATPPFQSLSVKSNPNIPLSEVIRMIDSLRNNKSVKVLRVSAQQSIHASKDGDVEHLPVLEAMYTLLQHNKTIIDLDCALSLDVMEDERIGAISHALLLNSLSR